MILWATQLALKAGVSEKLAKPVAIAGLVLVALLLLWVVKSAYDSDLIARDRLERENAEATQALDRERSATAAGEIRDDARRADTQNTEDELKEIHDADPDAANAPAGAGTRAVADRLRDDAGR